MSRISGLV